MQEQERASLGVLGALVAWLALAALATHPQTHPEPSVQASAVGQGGAPGSVHATDSPSKPAPSVAALTALRDGSLIDLNRATASDLELLPGIGPRLAERIVAHRAQCGGAFGSLEQVGEVSGIGPTKLAALRKTTCIGAQCR